MAANPIFETFLQRIKHTMSGKILEKRKLENNTYLIPDAAREVVTITEDQQIERFFVKLHSTNVLIVTPSDITVDSGRWYTVTTRDRINSYIHDTGFYVAVEKGVWYWHKRGKVAPFNNHDKLVWMSGAWGLESARPLTPEENKQIIASNVNSYVHICMRKRFPLDKNESGNDCWYCRNYAKAPVMEIQPPLPVDFTDEVNPLTNLDLPPCGGNYSEAVNDTGHLLEHIEHDQLPVELMKEALRFCNARANVTQFVLGKKLCGTQLDLDLLETENDEETLRLAAQRHLKKFLKYRLGL
jgi:hypothetical protein